MTQIIAINGKYKLQPPYWLSLWQLNLLFAKFFPNLQYKSKTFLKLISKFHSSFASIVRYKSTFQSIFIKLCIKNNFPINTPHPSNPVFPCTKFIIGFRLYLWIQSCIFLSKCDLKIQRQWANFLWLVTAE